MKNVFLQLWGVVPVSVLMKQIGPADVAPPPGQILALSIGVLIILGLLVATIIIGAILVIRAIKKNRSNKDNV